MELSPEMKIRILAAQRNEITEYHIYRRIAASLPDEGNRKVLEQIADDELGHYNQLNKSTGQDAAPKWQD